MGKYLTLCLVVILVLSSLLMVKPTSAQTIPTPSIPEFSVAVVDHSYDVPQNTTTTIDPYTGNQITNTQPGYHVENKTIDVTIRNQPFVSTNELIDLFFNIRLKGHFENNWRELYQITNRTNDNSLRRQSGTTFTVISIPQQFPENGNVDFQVEAFIAVGHIITGPFGYWTWQESGWSPTQTITITDNAFSSSITTLSYPSISPISTSTPSPILTLTPTVPASSPNPTVPEFPITASLVAVLVAVSLLLVISKRKRNQ